MLELGYKAAMTDVEAALLLPQLALVNERHALRRKLALRYERSLAEVPGVELIERVGDSAHHLFAVLVPAAARDFVLQWLGARRIGCAVNYRSIHTLSYYRERFGYQPDDLPNAALFGQRTLSLPFWPYMPEAHVARVANALGEALHEARIQAKRHAPDGVEALL
jgi:UDP-4-amino-4-deoxy-L-arabinose-oxoglutarate aminotransferase